MKNGYLVQCEFEFAVLAENEEEAKSFVRSAVDDMSVDLQDCCNVSHLNRCPDGWSTDCLVYNNGEGDITLGQALQKSEEYREMLNKFRAIHNKQQDRLTE